MAKLILFFVTMAFTSLAFSQTTVTGTIISADGGPLIAANILIKGTQIGTLSKEGGAFELTAEIPLPWELRVTYIGYAPQEVTVSDSQEPVIIELTEKGFSVQEVVVSVSRRSEKIQEAPASISVIPIEKIENQVVINPANLLKNVAGVQIDQQGSSRLNITMRDNAELFETSTFVLLDYRSLIAAGVNFFNAPASAVSTLDLERVEVVRGPGSALYGPGVTSGVVHFLSKDPFRYPGTSVEITGGELNTFRTSIRHAGHNKAGTFGYKINGTFSRADEWTLDPTDSSDFKMMSFFQDDIIDPITGKVARTTGGELAKDNVGYGGNLTLEFRPKEDLQIVTSAGANYFRGLFWNSQGEGLQQAWDYYAQARVQAGGFFGQIYYNANTTSSDLSKAGFLYRSGQLSYIDRKQLESQLQYTFDLKPIRTNITIGGEYRGAFSDTKARVYGRNEADDAFSIIGGYMQTKTNLTPKLDLVLAGRYDVFTSVDQNAFSPRAALVYKPNITTTFRASYNKAFAPNSALIQNVDLKLADLDAFDIWVFGNKEAQTFNNPATTWFIPGLGQTPGVGMDIGMAYGFITNVVAAQIAAGNPELAGLEPLLPILTNPGTMAAIAAAGGFSTGVPIATDGSPMNIEGTPTSKLREDDTWEIGYRGLIGNKLRASVDVYRVSRKSFTQIKQISPLVVLPTLGQDVSAEITPILTQIFTGAGVPNPEITAQQVAGAYQQVAGSVAQGPLGTVETDQMPNEGGPYLAFGYRNFGEIAYFGADMGLAYYIRDDLSVFGNYSWLNQTHFEGEDLGEPAGSTNTYDLNMPKNRFRMGVDYQPQSGFFGNLALQYNGEFDANLGLYEGTVASRTLMDAGAGYRFTNGLSVGVNGANILNHKYRSFPGFPQIGRRVTATARFSF